MLRATTLFDIPTTRIVNFVICLPTEHLGVLKISLNCIRAFQMNWGVLVFRERGKPEYPEKKPLVARERTNNTLNPHMMWTPGFEPGPHWWKASALTTAPPLLSEKENKDRYSQ